MPGGSLIPAGNAGPPAGDFPVGGKGGAPVGGADGVAG